MKSMDLLLLLGVAAVFALSVCWVFYPAPLSGMHGDAPYVALSVVALAVHVVHASLAHRRRRRQSVYRDAKPCDGAPCQCDAVDRDSSDAAAAQAIGVVSSGDGMPLQHVPVPAPPIPARRLHPAVHPFGGDPVADAVPRGALVICDPIAAQIDASGWQRFKWSVISRYGGPLSFALACEVHPDTLDQERWIEGGDKDGGNRDGPVVVGKVTDSQGAGITVSGQLVWHAGALRPHGYAIRRHPCGMVYEGRWNRGSWIDGYIYRPPTSKCDSVTRRVCPFSPDKIDFTVTWRAWDAEGGSRCHVRHPGPPSARRVAMSLAEWPYPNYSVYCGRWAPAGACATCICRFRNGDSYAEARDGDGPPTILYYYIDAVPRGQMIGNCEWTIVPAERGAVYAGSVFYPTDVKSSQFQAMADYVLSGRSSHAFSPAQHEAFARAIRAAAQAP